jgi:hypothetical protein
VSDYFWVFVTLRYGHALARDLISGLNWKDKLSLLLRQADDQRLHCCALGMNITVVSALSNLTGMIYSSEANFSWGNINDLQYHSSLF